MPSHHLSDFIFFDLLLPWRLRSVRAVIILSICGSLYRDLGSALLTLLPGSTNHHRLLLLDSVGGLDYVDLTLVLLRESPKSSSSALLRPEASIARKI